MDPFIGEIRSFGFNFQPRGWFFCDGRLLPIQAYTTLFSILGTTYGGNGTTTFALPNLQAQVPMHWGTAPSGFNTFLGDALGTPTVALQYSEMPQHTHQAVVATGPGAQRTANPTSNSYLSNALGGDAVYQKPPITVDATFARNAIGVAGGSAPHQNQQPYLAINFCIAYVGDYPPRS